MWLHLHDCLGRVLQKRMYMYVYIKIIVSVFWHYLTTLFSSQQEYQEPGQFFVYTETMCIVCENNLISSDYYVDHC